MPVPLTQNQQEGNHRSSGTLPFLSWACLESRLLTSEFPRPVNCISHPCTAASRQLLLCVGQSHPLFRNLNMVTEINWHSTAKHMSAWPKADVCTCWKHPSSNWLETLQFPEWRKMTFTYPCHWYETNRKAITGHLEPCLSCHGPVWKAGYWLRNFNELGRSTFCALGCVHLRHDLWKEDGEQIKNLLISTAQNHMFWCSSGNCPSYLCTVPSKHLPLWLVQLTSSRSQFADWHVTFNK